jgi:hypothetical protein
MEIAVSIENEAVYLDTMIRQMLNGRTTPCKFHDQVQARTVWGIQGGRRRPQAAPQTAVRPVGGWPARRVYKGRAWRARMKL